MKKIINGRLYDTETAKLRGTDDGGTSNFESWHEELYQKRTGEFFLYGVGGPATKYAYSIGQNQWSGGSKIIPLNLTAAQKWAEEHLDADEYEEIFGLPNEDAEPVALNIMVDAELMSKLRMRATEEDSSLTATITKLLQTALE